MRDMKRERSWGTKMASLAMSVAAHGALLALAWSFSPPPESTHGEVIEVSVLRIEPPAAAQAGRGSPSPVSGRHRATGRSPARRIGGVGVGAATVGPPPALPPGPGAAVGFEGSTGRAVAFAGDAAEGLGEGAMLAGVMTGDGEVVAAPDSAWLRKHRTAIERHLQREMDGTPYPLQARQRWWTGKVSVAFTLQPDGHVRDVRVLRSSGREVLDHCAVETVIDAAPYYPRPPADQEVEVPFEFRLVSM
jgi:TonB family protein